MSLMAGLTVLVKIIRSDVRVSFVSGPVTSQSVGSIVIEADPSLSFVVPVSHPSIQSHPTISHYKEPQKETRRRECCQWKKTEWKSLWRIRPQLFLLFFIHFPRVSNKISDRRVTQRLSSFGDGFSYTATTKRIHRQRSARRL